MTSVAADVGIADEGLAGFVAGVVIADAVSRISVNQA
jgi:hypothetical protein